MPLTELTKKKVAWKWGEEQDNAYKELIEALTGETILAHPRVDKGGWIVNTEASVGQDCEQSC